MDHLKVVGGSRRHLAISTGQWIFLFQGSLYHSEFSLCPQLISQL